MYTTCRVGVLSSEISKHSKISPPPSLRSHLTSSPMGVLSGDYGNSNIYKLVVVGVLPQELMLALRPYPPASINRVPPTQAIQYPVILDSFVNRLFRIMVGVHDVQ